MAEWLIAVCFVAVLVALAGRRGTGHKVRRAAGPGGHRAGWLPRAGRLAAQWSGLRVRRSVIRHWRPLAVIALVVPMSGLFDASGGGVGGRSLAWPLALEAAGSRSQDEGDAGIRKKRGPELVALQWNPTSQPFPEPRRSTSSPTVEPASPRPPAPRVVPPPSAPSDATVGVATWYGGVDGFGREDIMANGSYFDPDDPTTTAANRWPLGRWLRVCRGDRCIEVQVRDRGGFSHALDLSRAAFSQLASPSTGVIAVSISSLE